MIIKLNELENVNPCQIHLVSQDYQTEKILVPNYDAIAWDPTKFLSQQAHQIYLKHVQLECFYLQASHLISFNINCGVRKIFSPGGF